MMELSLKESLQKLERLSPARLHQASQRIRKELGGSEWKLGLCLLAAQRTHSFRKLGYATISRYAEQTLQISGKKAGALLSAAKVLEHHPLLSEAYRSGTLGWGKLRAIKGLITPETERQWLDFCLQHDTDTVANKVALSPRAWKRYRALQASLKEKPIAEPQELVALLKAEPESLSAQARLSNSSSGAGTQPSGPGISQPHGSSPGHSRPRSAEAACSHTARELGGTVTWADGSAPIASARDKSPLGETPPTKLGAEASQATEPSRATEPKPLPFAPQRIRLVIEMTPDQYALFERAESRVRARAQKRLPRAQVVTAMAEVVLNAGTARSRAKHQVLIHKDAQTGMTWYDSQRGPLPVDPDIVEKAERERPSFLLENGQISDPTPSQPTSPSELTPRSPEPQAENNDPEKRHRAIPNHTLRQVFAQAGQGCQACGDRAGPFETHHTTPFSEGGTHQLPCLRLLCRACHGLEHQGDFQSKKHWAAAKAARCRGGGN